MRGEGAGELRQVADAREAHEVDSREGLSTIRLRIGTVLAQLRTLNEWNEAMSLRLKMMEERLMWGEVLAYEMVRHYEAVLDSFVPPQGEAGTISS